MADSNPCAEGLCQLNLGGDCYAARSGVTRYCELIAAELNGNPDGTTYSALIQQATAEAWPWPPEPPPDPDPQPDPSVLIETRRGKPVLPLGQTHPECPDCKQKLGKDR